MASAEAQKIYSGRYASVGEVMRDGLKAIMEWDTAIDRGLR